MTRIAVVLVFLAGCGEHRGDDTPAPGRDGGAGADAVAAPDAAGASCGECAWGERCVDGACEVVTIVQVMFREGTYQLTDGSVEWEAGEVSGGLYRVIGEPFLPEPVEEAGPCAAYVEVPGGDPAPPYTERPDLDVGTFTISGGAVGTRTLTKHPDAPGFWFLDVPTPYMDFFAPGDLLTATWTGTADVPAGTMSVVAPALVTIQTGEVRRGEDLEVRWNDGSAGGPVDVFSVGVSVISSDNVSTYVSCLVEDDGAYTIPATLTRHLADDAIAASIGVMRQRWTFGEATGETSYEAVAMTNGFRDVVYVP